MIPDISVNKEPRAIAMARFPFLKWLAPVFGSKSSNDNGSSESLSRSLTDSTNPPPAYTPNRPEDKGNNEISPASYSASSFTARPADPTAPAPSDTPGTLPICPHESLTSARLDLIHCLPGLKPAHPKDKRRKVDAITSAPSAHHRLVCSTRVEDCKTACEPLGRLFNSAEKPNQTIAIQGKGEFSYAFLSSKDDGSESTSHLVLDMDWDIYILAGCKTSKVIDVLTEVDVRLCAHKRIADPEILGLIAERIDPEVGLRDPIVRYRKQVEGHHCKFGDTLAFFFLL